MGKAENSFGSFLHLTEFDSPPLESKLANEYKEPWSSQSLQSDFSRNKISLMKLENTYMAFVALYLAKECSRKFSENISNCSKRNVKKSSNI